MTMFSAEERAVASIPASKRTPAQKKLAAGLETSLRITWEEVAAAVSANPADMARRERLKRDIYEIERTLPRPPAHAMALVEKKAKDVDAFVLRRGDYKSRGPKVAPRPPGVILASQPAGTFSESESVNKEEKTGRRAALAAWLAVRRQSLDGAGDREPSLAASLRPGDRRHAQRLRRARRAAFPPRAARLARLGADSPGLEAQAPAPADGHVGDLSPVKQADAKLAADDPENTLFGRMNRRRLDAEGVRDAMLAVSGELNSKMEGPGVLAPHRKGNRRPDLHRGRSRRPLARRPKPGRAPAALALSLPQT